MAVKFDNEQQAEPQLTSLIDCVFLLLIFFLVSSQMKRLEKKLDIRLPEASVAKAFKMTPDLIRVSVSERGDLYVNTRPVGPGTLLAELRKIHPKGFTMDEKFRVFVLGSEFFSAYFNGVHVPDSRPASY